MTAPQRKPPTQFQCQYTGCGRPFWSTLPHAQCCPRPRPCSAKRVAELRKAAPGKQKRVSVPTVAGTKAPKRGSAEWKRFHCCKDA